MNDLRENISIRINVIIKDNLDLKISLIAGAKMSISKLKRKIEQQLLQLHNVNVLVSVIQDVNGFVLSNNSTVGQHLHNNQTVYIHTHKQKMGNDMNLPGTMTDIFMTLRYVCGSVIKKLSGTDINVDPVQIIPQILHLGFWYSNAQLVGNLCKYLNKILTAQVIDTYFRKGHEMQNVLLIKLLNFWLSQVGNNFGQQIGGQFMEIVFKLSLHPHYCELLKTSKMMKNILQMSKDNQLSIEIKRMALHIVRNVNNGGKNFNSKTMSSYIPSALGDSFYGSNIEQILDLLNENSQDSKNQGLEKLGQNCERLVVQATTRFDFYWKLTAILTIKKFKDKRQIKIFINVIKSLISHTTREKAKEVMGKDIIKRIHNCLLQSPIQIHSVVLQYFSLLSRQSSNRGIYNIQQGCQFLSSPYLQFQKINVDSLAEMSEKQKKIESIRFLPFVKDFIRLSLKTESEQLSIALLKIISNLTLDEQCRYQIINLKGIQLFVKFLEIGQKSGQLQMQRASAKGLLNLSLSGREVKATILSLMSTIFQKYYKGAFDGIANSYIENILKSSKI